MLELIWGLLNIAILIYFVIICFKSTKVIKEKLGIFASLIFVLGLLSFIVKPSDEESKSKIFDLQNPTIKQNMFKENTFSTRIILEENLTTSIEMSIMFGENKNKLISAQTNRSGFVSGTNWNVENVTIEKSKTDNKCFYNVSGRLEWKILGLKIYSESKYFKGEAELKK
jgi:hypothetical protein